MEIKLTIKELFRMAAPAIEKKFNVKVGMAIPPCDQNATVNITVEPMADTKEPTRTAIVAERRLDVDL
jgi:hypothetical protein